MGVCLIQIHSTPGTAPHHVKHSDNFVSRVHDLHNLGAVRFPRGKKPINPLLELGVAMKGPRLWDFGRKYHLAIRVIPGEERVNIAAVPSIDHSVHELEFSCDIARPVSRALPRPARTSTVR